MLWLTLFVFVAHLVVATATSDDGTDMMLIEHRLGLMEDGFRNFVYETKPSVIYLQNALEILRAENDVLKDKMADQERDIADLKWMVSENKKLSLTQEERDLVTELKWTIFDLKHANEILQQENCKQSIVCGVWTAWSQCSSTCGPGTRIRSRDCARGGRFASMCRSPPNVQEKECESDTSCNVRNLLPQFDCPENYTSFQGYCFRFSGRQDGRLLSTIICEEEDAHLVDINSAAKQSTVREYLNIVAPHYMVDMNEDFSQREYWDFKNIDQKTNVAIDGIRKHQRTNFLNWQGNDKKYFNWAVGQPRNDRSDGDYCVTLNVLTGEWYMLCCSVTFFYVCETEARI